MRLKYSGKNTNEISFPLGGIGTGSVGLAGNGALIDWEIFNIASKGSSNGYTHFALKAEKDGRNVDARVICGDLHKNLSGQLGGSFGEGLSGTTMQGFPHFRDTVFVGEYPIAELSFHDPDSVCSVKMTAFNPLIPHNEKDSSIPAAFFEMKITNETDETLDFTLAGSLCSHAANSHDEFVDLNAARGVVLSCCGKECNAEKSELSIMTDAEEISYQEYWYRGAWHDNLETYWKNFTCAGKLKNRTYNSAGEYDHATVAAHRTLAPGEAFTSRWLIGWYCPIKPDQWKYDGEQPATVRNYYSYVFDGVKSVSEYCFYNFSRLKNETMRWHDELFSSTLPREVIDAVSANTSVLKTETSIRVGEKGNFYGWEGLGEKRGSCEGTCTHVWNYAYAMPLMFPTLERGIRENDYEYNQKASGEMVFRTRIPFGRGFSNVRACADGQFGGIIKVYREWKLSGDTEWLRTIWKKVKASLEYAWSKDNYDKWDCDYDGVLEGRQHHTLDMELFGPSSWLEGIYLGALKAACEMANALGDTDGDKYLELYHKGRKWCAENLFNGKYFIQKIDLTDRTVLEKFRISPLGEDDDAVKNYWNEEAGEIKYQIGEGCAIDQLLAQWHADIVGLGDIFDADAVGTALGNMYKNNFKESMRSHYNSFRLFAVNDESGAVICDYPDTAAVPAIPIPYAQETMHGFEYAFAGLLISRGFVDEGLRIVRSVRDRYDGEKRNPWNEIECGSNYARSMASFALLPILSGFEFDMTRGMIGFSPKIKASADGFRCVWFVADCWGSVHIGKTTEIKIVSGKLNLQSVHLPYLKNATSVYADGKKLEFDFRDGRIELSKETVIEKSLSIE